MGVMPGELPRQIGKYRIDGLIGEGAMGVVYRGHDPDIDRVVAIKTVHAHLLSRTERAAWLERFAREAKAAGRCLHPNLVTVFDYLEVDETPYLVMEFIACETLAQRMDRPPLLPLERVVEVMRQMLDGLAAIHDAGIVHRDVKPANVLLLGDHRIKIADFGVARVEALGATHGGMIGTPAYMAPEQFLGGVIDPRTDLFAAGVIFFELLCGQKPFPAQALGELSRQVTTGAFRRPSQVAPQVPPTLDRLVERALHPDPARRFSGAGDFAAALGQAMTAQTLTDLAAWDRTVVMPAGGPAPAPISQTLAEQVPPAVFARIEAILAERIGPIAKVVLRSAASATDNIDQMVDRLAGQVGEGERAAFRAAVQSQLAVTTGPGSAISAEMIDEVTRLLTPHLGPMARILVRRAAQSARSRGDLRAALAGHIPNEAARTAFLKTFA